MFQTITCGLSAGKRALSLVILVITAVWLAATVNVFADESILIVESIEIEGNTRTSDRTIHLYMSIDEGDRVTADSILVAMEELKGSGIFRDVEFTVRKGSERGCVVLHIRVEELGAEFRFGLGHRNLEGWYLIPGEVRFDNRMGRGEKTRAHVMLGYRTAGVVFLYEEPRFGDGRSHWGCRMSALGHNRVYFASGNEYSHAINRNSFELHMGREVTPGFSWEIGGAVEGVFTESTATARTDNPVDGIEIGDELAFEQLPPTVAGDLGDEARGVFRFDLTWNSRAEERIVDTPVSGFWGRARVEEYLRDGGSFPVVTADLRGYRSVGAVAMAARLRSGACGWAAPFYDRFYTGGLYTVRGFPSQSLSVPEGETRFWSASIEMRGALVGNRRNPRLAGLLFVDAADGWIDDAVVGFDDISVGAGYGLRLRVPWVGWIGLDVGIPLTKSPVEEAFNVNGSIGWTF